jgi:predicted phosphodiesterase
MNDLLEIHAKGLLFIGDPHVSSKIPGRRLDADFCETVCGKLDQAFSIAAQGDLYPVILGDLFDDERDSKPAMLTRLIRSLASATIKPLTIVGNHEKTQFYLTDDTALAAIREAGLIDTLERAGARVVVLIGDKRVLIGGTPYGQDFPVSVQELRDKHDADWVIWLSHHDLAFQGAYPGSLPIVEIKGVDMLVNGHMHKPTPPVQTGSMTAFNPGNIVRMSVDCRDQKPAVWSWEPSLGRDLFRIELRHKADVMNLEGYVFNPAASQSVPEARADLMIKESMFARLLKQRQNEDASQTDDAQFLKEEMDGLHVEMATDDDFKAYMLGMLEESIQDGDSA